MDIIAIRWDTFIRNITLRDNNLTPINLTWGSLKFSIKKRYTDTTYIYTWSITITDAVNWKAKIEIAPVITKTWAIDKWVYDIEFTDSLWVVTTPIINSNFQVVYDVTI